MKYKGLSTTDTAHVTPFAGRPHTRPSIPREKLCSNAQLTWSQLTCKNCVLTPVGLQSISLILFYNLVIITGGICHPRQLLDGGGGKGLVSHSF